jgi:hypothetical protein
MWEKLKHEWKTAILAAGTTAVGVWDAGASAYDWTPVVPDHWRPYTPLALGTGFLLLRRWTGKKPDA